MIARIAGGQHGVATRRQLLDAGLTVDQVRQRFENRLLIAVHRGVYRVGHCAPSVTATYIAAVLAVFGLTAEVRKTASGAMQRFRSHPREGANSSGRRWRSTPAAKRVCP